MSTAVTARPPQPAPVLHLMEVAVSRDRLNKAKAYLKLLPKQVVSDAIVCTCNRSWTYTCSCMVACVCRSKRSPSHGQKLSRSR